MAESCTFTGKLADPEFRKRRAQSAVAVTNSPQARVRSLARSAAEANDLDIWAEQLAASLPALAPEAVDAITRLAVALDARARAENEGGGAQ